MPAEGWLDVELRPKAFELLRYLVERTGKLASKHELAAAVWPNVIGEEARMATDDRMAL